MDPRLIILLTLIACITVPVSSPAQEPTREQLLEKIKRLKADVAKMSDQLEGTAKPINLGRTDFASVSASSVNGDRPLANKFYGVLNAFDDGENWHNNINYTYWLSQGALGACIEVRFDEPVNVTDLIIERGPICTPVFRFAKGGEEPYGPFTGALTLAGPIRGVTSVRLNFYDGGTNAGNLQVNEVRIMGYPPPGRKYNVTQPRLDLSEQAAVALAREEFREAGFSTMHVTTRSTTQQDSFEILFHHTIDEVDLFRVTIHRPTARVETKKLAKWTTIETDN